MKPGKSENENGVGLRDFIRERVPYRPGKNRFAPTRHGHCACCDVQIERMVQTKTGPRPVKLPLYSQATFLLSDGSHMDVALCTHCRHDWRGPRSHREDRLWQSILQGWNLEVEFLVERGGKGKDKKWKADMAGWLNKQAVKRIEKRL